ncbi:MAG: cadherin domain-containing protein, partial [Planctomycetaceae bacterium]|nr:cadherin domain-containing protein [Planctomycetaceae bacterium]
ATSADGSSSVQTYTIAVVDVNDNVPVIQPSQELTLSEAAASGTLIGTVHATDVDLAGLLQNWSILDGNAAGHFVIDAASGQLILLDRTGIDFETTPFYDLTLQVSDGVQSSASQVVRIRLLDINEAPVFGTAPTLTVPENAAAGTVVGQVSASDVDAGDVLSYQLTGGVPVQPFAIDPVTGIITVANPAGLDFESTTSIQLTVTVTDAGGLQDLQTVTVNLSDLNERPISLSLAGGTVAENSISGTYVGTVSGVDVDASDDLQYSLLNNAGQRFWIDSTTGNIYVTSGLNYEASPAHSVTVRATDSGGLTHDQAFTITVTDVNDAPVAYSDSFVGAQLQKIEETKGTILLNDADEDGDHLTVQLISGPERGSLVLNANGTFVYEPDGVFSGCETFTYVVSDGQFTSNVATVTLDIRVTLGGSGSGSGGSSGSGTTGSGGDSSSAGTGGSGSGEDGGSLPGTPPSTGNGSTNNTINSSDSGARSSNRDPGEEMADEVTTDVSAMLVRLADITTMDEMLAASTTASIFLDTLPTNLNPTSVHRSVPASVPTEHFSALGQVMSLDQSRLFLPNLSLRTSMEESGGGDDGMAWDKAFRGRIVVGTTAVVSTSMTVGYVIWLLRGGSLLTAFLSSLPAWQSFDPLPILEAGEALNDDDDDTLLSLVTEKTPHGKQQD